MTDLEGVAGVLDSANWCLWDGKYYDQAKELLTLEVNAAADALFAGGAEDILVSDSHGPGAINPGLIDPRVKLTRGSPNGWPLELDRSFDALVFVGQHAMASTPRAHLCHTQNMGYINLAVNGRSIGEFGQLAMCASELEVRTIFGSGDLAFIREAQALVPGIETVSVKQGLRKDRGEGLNDRQYRLHNAGAIHVPPERARKLIHEGALKAIYRANREGFGIIRMKPPYTRVAVFRPTDGIPHKRTSRETHRKSFIGLLNMPFNPVPLQKEA
jgi:D-amino peptidase